MAPLLPRSNFYPQSRGRRWNKSSQRSAPASVPPPVEGPDEFVRMLNQLRDTVRHAEELYERVRLDANGIAPPAPRGPSAVRAAA